MRGITCIGNVRDQPSPREEVMVSEPRSLSYLKEAGTKTCSSSSSWSQGRDAAAARDSPSKQRGRNNPVFSLPSLSLLSPSHWLNLSEHQVTWESGINNLWVSPSGMQSRAEERKGEEWIWRQTCQGSTRCSYLWGNSVSCWWNCENDYPCLAFHFQ